MIVTHFKKGGALLLVIKFLFAANKTALAETFLQDLRIMNAFF